MLDVLARTVADSSDADARWSLVPGPGCGDLQRYGYILYTEAGPLVPCSFVGTTSRSRAAERRLALRQTLGAEVSAQCKLKVRSKSDELEAHSDPETAELSRQASAGDASQPP